jgi:hypothetical protein
MQTNNRNAWFNIQFKPDKIDSAEIAKKMKELNVPDLVSRVRDDQVDVLFKVEMPQIPDLQLNKYFVELLSKAGVDLSARL